MTGRRHHPNDCAWRHAGKLVLLAILGSQLIAVRPGWAAFNLPMMIASLAGCSEPSLIVGHRPLNGKYAAFEVGHDQIEGLVVSQGSLAPSIVPMAGTACSGPPRLQ